MPAQTVIKVRRDTAANWISADPTLASGEIGFETDTNQLKIGNGTSAWTVLPYASGAGGASVEISETAPTDPEQGDVWFNSTDGRAYIYYDSTWVDLNPGIAGPIGPAGIVTSTTAPSDTSVVWLDTDEVPDVPVPAGGTDGQVLKKTSSTDYATAWENTILHSATAPADTSAIWYNTEDGNAYVYYDGFWVSISGLPSGVPAGGTAGQVLVKSNSTDYATQWVAPFGLQLIRSATVSGVNTLSIGSNADPIFSSTYDNYRVLISSNNSTDAARSWTLRMRANTTDESGTVYNQMATGIDRAGTAQNNVSVNATSGAIHNNCNLGAFRAHTSFDLSSPFLTQETNLVGSNVGFNATNSVHQTFGVIVATNTSYNGLTITNSSGNFLDGTIEIYGYKKA